MESTIAGQQEMRDLGTVAAWINEEGQAGITEDQRTGLQMLRTGQLTHFVNEQASSHTCEPYARWIGVALRIIKGRLEFGEWQSWLSEQFKGSLGTAERYIEASQEPFVAKKQTVENDVAPTAFELIGTAVSAKAASVHYETQSDELRLLLSQGSLLAIEETLAKAA